MIKCTRASTTVQVLTEETTLTLFSSLFPRKLNLRHPCKVLNKEKLSYFESKRYQSYDACYRLNVCVPPELIC